MPLRTAARAQNQQEITEETEIQCLQNGPRGAELVTATVTVARLSVISKALSPFPPFAPVKNFK
jgi:hypothetical protein